MDHDWPQTMKIHGPNERSIDMVDSIAQKMEEIVTN